MTIMHDPFAETFPAALGTPYDRLPPALKSVVQRDLIPRYSGTAFEAPDDCDDDADETRTARGIMVGLILSLPCLGAIGAVVWWLVD